MVARDTVSEAAPALFSTGAAPAQRPAPMAHATHTPTVNTPVVLVSFSMGDRPFIAGSATDTDAESTYDEGSDEGSTTSDNGAWSAASTEQVTAEWDEEEPEEDAPTTSSDAEEEQEDEDEEDYQGQLDWMARTVHLHAPSRSFVLASVPEDPFQSRPRPAWLCSSHSTSLTPASRIGRCHGLPAELVLAFAMGTHERLGAGSAAGREEEGCPYLMMPADLVKRVVEACGERAENELGEGVVRLMGGLRTRGEN